MKGSSDFYVLIDGYGQSTERLYGNISGALCAPSHTLKPITLIFLTAMSVLILRSQYLSDWTERKELGRRDLDSRKTRLISMDASGSCLQEGRTDISKLSKSLLTAPRQS